MPEPSIAIARPAQATTPRQAVVVGGSNGPALVRISEDGGHTWREPQERPIPWLRRLARRTGRRLTLWGSTY